MSDDQTDAGSKYVPMLIRCGTYKHLYFKCVKAYVSNRCGTDTFRLCARNINLPLWMKFLSTYKYWKHRKIIYLMLKVPRFKNLYEMLYIVR